MVAPGEEVEGMYYPYSPIFVESKNKTSGATFTDYVTVTLYEQDTKDDAAAANSATEIVNEAKLADITADLMDVVAAQSSTVKNGDTVSLETGTPLTVTIDVSNDPEVPAGYARNYYMVRFHDGVAETIGVEYSAADKTVKGDSDRFSAYLIAYKDTEAAKAPNSGVNTIASSGTASASYVGLIAMAALVSLLGAGIIIRKHA